MRVFVVHHTPHGEEGEILGVFSNVGDAEKYSNYLKSGGYWQVRISTKILDESEVLR